MSDGPLRAAIRRMITVRWRLRIWAAIAIVFGLLVGQLPLFGVLGFELALAASLLGSILGLDVGRAFAKELQRERAGIERATWPGRILARSSLAAVGVAVALILLPVPICAVRGLWTPTCDWWFGIVTYLALPVMTTALAALAGHAIGALVGPRRFVGVLLYVVLWIAVAFAAFWRFYTEPPVFTYNAILGYFPGNVYDENVQIKGALWWSRLEQLLWIATVLALVATRLDVPTHRLRWRAPRPAGRRWRPALFASGVGALALVMHLQSGALGYALDDVDLEEALGGRIETEHFVIYHSTRPDVVEDIELVARDHEFRYAQVVARAGIAPSGKIRSFVFADRDEKYRLFGAKYVEMAKPWLRDIYLEHRSFPHSSLRHEIAHAVASEFGDPIFGVAAQRVLGVPALFSPGLIEGLAVALDWPGSYERPTAHEGVRAMQEKGLAPSVDQLFGLGFFAFSSARGYTTAGSFLRFLLERHGATKVRALYESGGAFEESFGVSRGELEREWHEFLATVQIPPTLAAALEERFRTASVFARPCPHAIAKRREKAAIADREGDRARAVALSRKVCKNAPEEPRYRHELASYLHDGSDAETAEAEQLWSALAGDASGITSSLRAKALEGLALLAVRRGDLARARQLLAEAAKLPLEQAERRQVDNKVFALAHAGPAAAMLRDYAFPPKTGADALALTEKMVELEPALGHGHYLLGIQRAFRRDWASAAVALAKSIELGLLDVTFVKNAARLLAITAYRANDLPRVREAIAVLARTEMSTGDKLLAKDWTERLAFDEQHRR